MVFYNNKSNGIHTAINGKYIFTLICTAYGKYNAYASGHGLMDDNVKIAENVSYSDAVNVCENYG